MHILRSASLGFCAVSLLAGCASSSSPTAANAAKPASDEYADYIPTGSHIAGKVKKQQNKPSAEKNAHDQELMRQMQVQQPDPAGPLPK